MHPEVVVLKFLDAVDSDLQHGGLRDVDSYVGLFPDHAKLIRSEYAHITEDSIETASPSLIGGRYRIIESLGRGGFGEVFLAQDLQLDRRVAVKMLAGLRTIGKEWRARLIREAEAQNRIDNDSICPVHDVGLHAGSPFLVMPWIAGSSLDRLIASSAAHREGPVRFGGSLTGDGSHHRSGRRDAFCS